jgi:ABC-type transport system substrate-binding protein
LCATLRVRYDQSAYDALEAGQAKAYQDYSTFTTVKTVKAHYRVTAVNIVQDSPYEIQLNTLRPPFNNLLAREAICYATNPAPIDKTVANLMNEGAAATTAASQTKIYQEIWKYISDKAYMVFLFGLPYFNVTEKQVTGPGLSTDGFQVTWQDVKVS